MLSLARLGLETSGNQDWEGRSQYSDSKGETVQSTGSGSGSESLIHPVLAGLPVLTSFITPKVVLFLS